MKYQTYSHRNAEVVLSTPEFEGIFAEIKGILDGISEQEIANLHLSKHAAKMSLSHAINQLLKERFVEKGWTPESPIFQDDNYTDKKWRLDFAKDTVSIEVAFNHGEAIAWNLIKPVLASELNHVKKAIQTKIGVIITATRSLKQAGAFDSAVGEYEKFLRYLIPMGAILSAPLWVIGLEAPTTFVVEKKKIDGRNIGTIVLK